MNDLRRREFLKAAGLAAATAAMGRRALAQPLAVSRAVPRAVPRKCNIIFIMSDDQGYGDLGCYGSKHVVTPNLDRMAAEGTRFTDAYVGSPVCGPTRCTLMTGMHSGHATRRGNTAKAAWTGPGRPLVPLRAKDYTVAALLKKAGYATGGIGKWGLGNPGTTGTPDKHGFDYFFGYLDQVHAHNYYTDYLLRNGKRVELPGNTGGRKTQYTHDLFAEDALKFIRKHKDEPFFLYLPYTVPHGKYVVPDDAPYSDKPWSKTVKNYAAMITRMDRDIGRMFALLKELALDENTIVFFTSDNGPNRPFVAPLNSNGPFRGIKRQVLEGGIRTPMIVRWPGKVPAGKVSDFAWAFYDFLPTAAAIAGVEAPKNVDGMSVLPTLLGNKQKPHEFLYWEFYSPFQQAVRMGKWKAIRYGTEEPIELYDLGKDLGEASNLAAEHADIVKRMAARMAAEHVDTKYWPTVAKRKGARKPRGRKRKKK